MYDIDDILKQLFYLISKVDYDTNIAYIFQIFEEDGIEYSFENYNTILDKLHELGFMLDSIHINKNKIRSHVRLEKLKLFYDK